MEFFSSLNYIITILSGLRLSYAKTFSVYTCDHLDFCFMFCASSQKKHFFFSTFYIIFIYNGRLRFFDRPCLRYFVVYLAL